MASTVDTRLVQVPGFTHARWAWSRREDFEWRPQVHGCEGGFAGERAKDQSGDWLATSTPGESVGVGVADCTAILAEGCVEGRPTVWAIHAGWRGTVSGIISKVWNTLKPQGSVRVWLSPSIGPCHFEVGEEVIDAFGTAGARWSKPAPATRKYLLDLKSLQIEQLKALGADILNSPLCTYCQRDFYSYRRSGHQGIKLQDRHWAWIQVPGVAG